MIRQFFLLSIAIISGIANSAEIFFQEFEHQEERWNLKKLNTKNRGIEPQAIANQDVTLLNIDAGNLFIRHSDDGIYTSSNGFDDFKLVVKSNTLEDVYRQDFAELKKPNSPYINYANGLLAITAYIDKSNIINIYDVVSSNEIKVVYKNQQKGIYYPIKFGTNREIFYLNKNIIYKLNLSASSKQQEYFFKPPSCNRILDYNISKNHQVISYACSDEKSQFNNIFVYNRHTKIVEKICDNCSEAEHDLSDNGQHLLYVRHNEKGSTLNEFSFETNSNEELYETENWLVRPLYLNRNQ
ncbi:MAG: hypothetical protein HRT92_03625 [Piscirickettsiaceae bacterium]|nr:hypothetical protein [Piscirickettsiaceae bacterium]